jgi:phenylpropionate dioxygenase-like ring-hydroxylating dioxygenase large terminal subunit
VIVKSETGLRAFQGGCPHRDALLDEGEMHGTALVCPATIGGDTAGRPASVKRSVARPPNVVRHHLRVGESLSAE